MKEIGEYLKNRRIELGISLDEAEQFLKIRKKYLIAIEEGDESVLPGKTYFVGYLRNYATYLEADQDYINQLLAKQVQVSKPIEPEPDIKKIKTSRYFYKGKRTTRIKKEKKPINIIPLLKVFLVILLIGGFVFVINQFLHRIKQPSSISIVPEGSISEEKTKEQELVEIAKENILKEESDEEIEDSPLKQLPEYKPIEVLAREPTWIQIIQEDKILFEGIISSEEKILVKADNLISLITSSPNKISVSYNDQKIEPQPLEKYRLVGYQIMPNNT